MGGNEAIRVRLFHSVILSASLRREVHAELMMKRPKLVMLLRGSIATCLRIFVVRGQEPMWIVKRFVCLEKHRPPVLTSLLTLLEKDCTADFLGFRLAD